MQRRRKGIAVVVGVIRLAEGKVKVLHLERTAHQPGSKPPQHTQGKLIEEIGQRLIAHRAQHNARQRSITHQLHIHLILQQHMGLAHALQRGLHPVP